MEFFYVDVIIMKGSFDPVFAALIPFPDSERKRISESEVSSFVERLLMGAEASFATQNLLHLEPRLVSPNAFRMPVQTVFP